MTAAHQSLSLDKSLCLHYYHCVLYDIPFHLPVAEVAPLVVPQHDSDVVKKLAAAGCRVVPHQLHVFKEPLDSKFGYVSFFIHQLPHSTAEAVDIHRLMLEWIDLDLTSQLANAQVKVHLAQPPECHSSEPFLDALRQQCPLLDPGRTPDTKKLETFLLTRVRFGDLHENASVNVLNASRQTSSSPITASEPATSAADEQGDKEKKAEGEDGGGCPGCRSLEEHVWRAVGSFSIHSLQPKELLWIKKQVASFPPVLVTNGDVANAHFDEEKLATFFEASLAPLITVEEVEASVAENKSS